jgi:hypothetical protein
VLPDAHAAAPPRPSSEVGQRTIVLGQAEVLSPAPDVLVEVANPVGQRDAPAAPGQLTQPVAKVLAGLVGPLAARALEGTPQEHTLMGRTDRTLVRKRSPHGVLPCEGELREKGETVRW